MRTVRMPFRGPFFDLYRIGFSLYRTGERNWRQRTLAGVSWNALERKAYFFNPDGLALPLEPHPWELPEMLGGHTVRREFGKVAGVGLFAMPVRQRNALTADGLAEWVTCWLVADDAPYANDPETWATYVERDLAAERRACEAAIAIGQGIAHEAAAPASAEQQLQASIEARRRYLQAEYAYEIAEDSRIAQWLRGGSGEPPLLALVEGKTA
ncbi:hypothetical protein ACSMFT_07730 [Ectopseudomonas oleovorans]|uniref:hypothetical protein n=1 Tax=Ectopseudomonas oleovorans TaxID=301 RepID=UPI003F1A1CCB